MKTLTPFPMTAAMRERLAERETSVAIARRLLRSKEPHRVTDIRAACETLMNHGDHLDWVEAHHMWRALDERRSEAGFSPRRGYMIRALDSVNFVMMLVVVIMALALVAMI